VLQERLEFHPEADRDILGPLPSAPAVFVLRGADPASEPYVSKTANLRRRLERLLLPPEARTKRLNLRDRVRTIEYTLTGSDFESGFLLYQLLRAHFPETYSKRLRLRFAAVVKLHLDNEYPRASVSTRVGRLAGKNIYYGPFPSRLAAEKFMNDALDFFKMRRCTFDLDPDPEFPGCVYSEMKMCLAPCFRGCTDDEYRAEVVRVEDFLNSRGESLKRQIASERDRASESLAFEEAAALHARLEKLAPVLQQMPEAVQRVDRMRALVVQQSAARESVALFRVDAGAISGPLTFPISGHEHAKSRAGVPSGPGFPPQNGKTGRSGGPGFGPLGWRSMEARIQAALAEFPAAEPRAAVERMEHLAILKRWCYRGTRKGEIFFADAKGDLPMRRIVRGIGRVYKGEAPETTVPRAAPAAAEGSQLPEPSQ